MNKLYLFKGQKRITEEDEYGICMSKSILKIGFTGQEIDDRISPYKTSTPDPELLEVIEGGSRTDLALQRIYNPEYRSGKVGRPKDLAIPFNINLIKNFKRFDKIERCIKDAKHYCLKNDLEMPYCLDMESELYISRLVKHLIKFVDDTFDFTKKKEFDDLIRRKEELTNELIQRFNNSSSYSEKYNIKYRNNSYMNKKEERDYYPFKEDYVFPRSLYRDGVLKDNLVLMAEKFLVDNMVKNGCIS